MNLAEVHRIYQIIFLTMIYARYRRWITKKNLPGQIDRLITDHPSLARQGIHPLKTMIDAGAPQADRKSRSRWARALQAADADNIAPDQLVLYLYKHGGISGAAAKIAKNAPLRVTRKRNAWV